MSEICLLLDENIPLTLQAQLEQTEPQFQVYAIGDGLAPSKGASDPDILIWIEEQGCFLVTNNRATMPVHLQTHLEQGRHVSGIIQLPKRFDIGAILADLMLILGASHPDEFQDQIIYLPLRT